MRTVIFLACFVCCCVPVFSQNSYINANGKIIPGAIENYKEWNRNPTQVVFREGATGSIVTLTPQTCVSFTVGLDTFVSYKGSRIENTDDVMGVAGYKSKNVKKDSIEVFLRQIYRYGGYTLYKFLDGIRTNFYFSDNGAIQELQYYEYIQEDETDINKNRVIPYEGYKQYLLQVLADKSGQNLPAKLKLLSYQENDLINFLAFAFNDKAQATEKRRNRYPAETFIGADVNANKASLLYSSGKSAFTQTSYAPSLEIGLRLYAQRNFGKIFFQPSLGGMPLSSKFSGNTYKLSATLLNANIGFGYMFIKQKSISAFVTASGGLYLPVGLKSSWYNGTTHKNI